jgi:hypothetical protein
MEETTMTVTTGPEGRTTTTEAPSYDVRQLLRMSRRELKGLYRRSPAAPVPVGDSEGTAILAPGTVLAPILAKVIRLVWQGKVFAPEGGELYNKMTPLRLRAFRALVYVGPSLEDGGDCIVIDYSRTSRSARWVRDEIRRVGPGVYLGLPFVWRRRVGAFALRFPAASGAGGSE